MKKGIMSGGKFIKLLSGVDDPIFEDYAGGGGGGGGEFSDPSTQLLQQYLNMQMGSLEQQRTAQEQANAAFRAKMPEIQASTDKLIAYLNQRAGQLQQGPYTGTEQEILRTQALEPIERDRAAAQRRALERIGARGLTPESGISQALMGDVDRGFDQSRAYAQNELGYRTIQEQRQRQQEAQQLLGLVPQIQRGVATGDLSFLQALDAAANAPREQTINYAAMNQRLPGQAMAEALAAMGAGPSPASVGGLASQLFGAQNQQQQFQYQQQQQRNQDQSGWWNMLGAALPYLMR